MAQVMHQGGATVVEVDSLDDAKIAEFREVLLGAVAAAEPPALVGCLAPQSGVG